MSDTSSTDEHPTGYEHTTSTAAQDALARSATTATDERLAYQGVFQRMFIRPETGALIGAVGIWVFFWAVAIPFGTASGAQNYLDLASTLGIMAVAVSALMIGGEFDLSSGANTGAMGILTIYLVKETGPLGGLGLPIWLGLIVSFAVAMAIGWLNGFMVQRTQLPSFIVTLATFFALWGLKLGLSKRFVDKIEMGRMDEGQGYDFWHNIFAAQWNRLDHVFEARDTVYTVLVLTGLGIVVLGIYEMHFERRDQRKPGGLAIFVTGIVGVVAGIGVLHLTDSTAMNWVGALVIAVGAIVTAVGLGTWRFQPISERGTVQLGGEVVTPLVGGIVAVIGSFVTAIAIDSSNNSDLIFPFTVQGMRATVFGVLGIVGFVLLFVAATRAKRNSIVSKSVVSTIIAGLFVVAAFVLQFESTSYKFRAEAFTCILVAALLLVAWTIAGLLFEERSRPNSGVDRFAYKVLAFGGVLAIAGLVIKTLFITQAELDAGDTPAIFSVRILWFVAVTVVIGWVFAKTRFGSWSFAVGGNAQAARQVGVPAAETKTRLFMLVSGAAWLVGVLIAFRINAIQANQGNGQEFVYIIAAVVGGTLLTGGYGTVLGGAIGALVMSMAEVGIPNSRWESDWKFLFLGVILLTAVIANRFIKDKAEALRK